MPQRSSVCQSVGSSGHTWIIRWNPSAESAVSELHLIHIDVAVRNRDTDERGSIKEFGSFHPRFHRVALGGRSSLRVAHSLFGAAPITNSSVPLFMRLRILHCPLDLMRSIIVYTITKFEFICILNRNMRFYVSRCIAAQVREVEVRYFSVVRISNVCCRNKRVIYTCDLRS